MIIEREEVIIVMMTVTAEITAIGAEIMEGTMRVEVPVVTPEEAEISPEETRDLIKSNEVALLLPLFLSLNSRP